MQNQPKTAKSFRHRNPTTRVGSRSLKDDLDNTHSTHQTNIHQNMMDAPQNEDRAMKSSIKASSFTNFKQQTILSEQNLNPFERVQEQIEDTLNNILGKDKHFESSSYNHPKSILIDKDSSRSGLMGQILQLKAANRLHDLDLIRIMLETQQEILLLNSYCSHQSLGILNLTVNRIKIDGIQLIAENSGRRSLHTLNLGDTQIDDLETKYSLVKVSWMKLEVPDLNQNPLLKDLRIMDLKQNGIFTRFERLICLQPDPLQNFHSAKEKNSVYLKGRIKSQDSKYSREVKRNSAKTLREVPSALIMESLEPNKRSLQALSSSDNGTSQNTD